MSQATALAREGYAPVPGGRVWYMIAGVDTAIPLVTLHGGPGTGHDYLEPLAALADERPVVLYDQLGCGKSGKPDDSSLWRIERFVAELDALRKALNLERIHLFGHSWGGWLAIEYMLSKPSGVISLTLASTSASVSEWEHEVSQLVERLPEGIRDTLKRGDLHDPAYEAAAGYFYQQHVCRLDPWPEPLMRTLQNITGNPVYEIMQGPNELIVTGNLKDWNRTDRLKEIRVPTLITCGRYDEIPSNCAATLQRGIGGSELRIFENSSHMAMHEEPEAFVSVLRDFMRRVEARAAGNPGRETWKPSIGRE